MPPLNDFDAFRQFMTTLSQHDDQAARVQDEVAIERRVHEARSDLDRAGAAVTANTVADYSLDTIVTVLRLRRKYVPQAAPTTSPHHQPPPPAPTASPHHRPLRPAPAAASPDCRQPHAVPGAALEAVQAPSPVLAVSRTDPAAPWLGDPNPHRTDPVAVRQVPDGQVLLPIHSPNRIVFTVCRTLTCTTTTWRLRGSC